MKGQKLSVQMTGTSRLMRNARSATGVLVNLSRLRHLVVGDCL